jgi:hypothetical protein
MAYDAKIEFLEAEWAPGAGFFWQLRQDHFAPDASDRVLEALRTISVEEETLLPRRLVSLLWYIPLFMQWQAHRLREGGSTWQDTQRRR